MQDKKLSHIDEHGNALMVDVSAKNPSLRRAIAAGRIKMQSATFATIEQGQAKKGDVLGVAQVAGIMATKRTSELIPLCHPLFLEKAAIDFALDKANSEIIVTCTVLTSGKTGVEMEALTGASVALLTIYDMCKAIDRSMEITAIRLLEKHGGKSGSFINEARI